jgi:hypothetical protein
MTNTQKQKSSRKRIIAFLLMLSLVLTSGTFAYWASEVEGTKAEAEGTLAVGSGDNVETTFNLTNELNSGGYLVPAEQVENSGEEAVGSIDLSFDVQWLEDEETSQLAGTNSVGEINVDHEVKIYLGDRVLDADEFAVIYNLISVDYIRHAETIVLDAEATTFSFQVTMDEPANQEQYNLIADAKIVIDFSYSIDQDSIVTSDLK